MSEQEERRDDVPPRDADDDRWQMGDPSEEGQEGESSSHQGEEGQEPA